MNRQWSVRTVLFASIGMSVLAIVLAYVHPVFALLAVLLCALVSYYAVNLVSRVAFNKDFQPPTRGLSGWAVSRRWSDWLLLLPWVLLFVNLLFAFGEVADCMHDKNLWKSGWSLCGSVSD
jgi:hypothetical protein